MTEVSMPRELADAWAMLPTLTRALGRELYATYERRVIRVSLAEIGDVLVRMLSPRDYRERRALHAAIRSMVDAGVLVAVDGGVRLLLRRDDWTAYHEKTSHNGDETTDSTKAADRQHKGSTKAAQRQQTGSRQAADRQQTPPAKHAETLRPGSEGAKPTQKTAAPSVAGDDPSLRDHLRSADRQQTPPAKCANAGELGPGTARALRSEIRDQREREEKTQISHSHSDLELLACARPGPRTRLPAREGAAGEGAATASSGTEQLALDGADEWGFGPDAQTAALLSAEDDEFELEHGRESLVWLVPRRFRKLHMQRFSVDPSTAGSSISTLNFPERLGNTARARGVEWSVLLAEKFGEWADEGCPGADEVSPYAAFAARFDRLVSPPKARSSRRSRGFMSASPAEDIERGTEADEVI